MVLGLSTTAIVPSYAHTPFPHATAGARMRSPCRAKRSLPPRSRRQNPSWPLWPRLREQAVALLAALRSTGPGTSAPPQLRLPIAPHGSPAPRTGAEKIRLFRSLFRGRTDVFPNWWENAKQERSGYAPACANEWLRGICEKPKVRCGECPNQAFLEVEDRVIADDLGGKYTAGVYPLLRDDTCWFVALDFDEASWIDDVAAFVETCRGHALAPAVERSRSGKGAHVWFFFAAPVPAREARDMASFLLTETMRLRRELKLESYDRLSIAGHASSGWIRESDRPTVSISPSEAGAQPVRR